MISFVKNYFPVFMLGALFGKLIELSGFAKALAAAISRIAGQARAMLGIVVRRRAKADFPARSEAGDRHDPASSMPRHRSG